MGYYTAQCDVNGVCFAVTETTGPLMAPLNKVFVPLDEFDETLIGKTWNGTEWIDAEPKKEPPDGR